MKPPYTRMALAISLALLAGCSTVQRVNQTMSDTDTTYNQAQGHFQKMANGKPVSDITTQWINPVPITEPVKGAQLPGCAITYTNPGKVSLNDLSAFITRTCRIPVVIAPDAVNAIAAGVTEKITG